MAVLLGAGCAAFARGGGPPPEWATKIARGDMLFAPEPPDPQFMFVRETHPLTFFGGFLFSARFAVQPRGVTHFPGGRVTSHGRIKG